MRDPRGGPTVLISSAGRRVELLRAFRRTLDALASGAPSDRGRVLAVDCSWYSSAFHDADEAFLVPRCTDPDFVPRMVDLCQAERVDLVVPTIDPELPVYAGARDQFAAVNTTVAISSPEVVAIASDKRRTHDWLTTEGFPTVMQGTLADVRADPEAWRFPLVVKPRFGSASVGVTVVDSPAELERAVSSTQGRAPGHGDPRRHVDKELVVQTLARGIEHTVDALVTRDGSDIAAVPRRRIEVRSGEVAKAVTVRSPALIELTQKLCTALPGAYGPLNIQIFLDEESEQLAVIELNARFGGGFPLSFAAGADFPQALLQEALGLPVTAPIYGWHDNLVMLRYDAALFVDGAEAPDR